MFSPCVLVQISLLEYPIRVCVYVWVCVCVCVSACVCFCVGWLLNPHVLSGLVFSSYIHPYVCFCSALKQIASACSFTPSWVPVVHWNMDLFDMCCVWAHNYALTYDMSNHLFTHAYSMHIPPYVCSYMCMHAQV